MVENKDCFITFRNIYSLYVHTTFTMFTQKGIKNTTNPYQTQFKVTPCSWESEVKDIQIFEERGCQDCRFETSTSAINDQRSTINGQRSAFKPLTAHNRKRNCSYRPKRHISRSTCLFTFPPHKLKLNKHIVILTCKPYEWNKSGSGIKLKKKNRKIRSLDKKYISNGHLNTIFYLK